MGIESAQGIKRTTSIALRLLWLLAFLFNIYILIFNYPKFAASLFTACSDATGISCNRFQILDSQLAALAKYGITLREYAIYALVCDIVATLCLIGTGLLIFWRKSAERMSLFVSLLLITFGSFGMNEIHIVRDPPFIMMLISMLFILLKWPALGMFFCTFPDGRFVPRWSWMLLFLFVMQLGLFILLPYPYNIENWPPMLSSLELFLVYGSVASTQVYRFFADASPQQKQQIKWLAFGFGISVLLMVIMNLLPAIFTDLHEPDSLYQLEGPLTTMLAYLPIPIGIGIALQRYRLWDIDAVINRTLVYVVFSACILCLYILVVFGASSLLQVHNNLIFSAMATALIAVIMQPMRLRLQHAVNRLMFGDRVDPYRALSNLGKKLEESLPADALLPKIVESVAHALRLPYVAIVWHGTRKAVDADPIRRTVAYGVSKDSETHHRIPMVHQGEQVGELILSPRQRGEELTSADLRLVRDLVPQIGIAVHSARLTDDLRRLTDDLLRSRERLVTAREEERRRLRRDLHDGLGPMLSSQTFTLSAVKKQLRERPDVAENLLADAIVHTQEAISDIRRLVYALRPPALDDLGLFAALREQIAQYQTSGIDMELDVPESLPPLPAAIEMACYRIVQEALTNIVRHAHATAASVRLRIQDALIIEVTDNGQGLPPATRAGVGFRSMHERAEELGGICTIGNLPHAGTRVYAKLPFLYAKSEDREPVTRGEIV
ncbi:sensor histidine kinase [Cohnella sp. REN36]|uniref:sensor histidine kinase n=1 Tax=Cohnella sp. REN36 TaxID=2887347 RepID=UPI001D13B124|nr:sensor histidine kinase [Cohnella sp. REN36]MCC3372147.1 sensor histidine kinase [Cohnella sp. REN36]